jgi:AcrR family transcriptional regulator
LRGHGRPKRETQVALPTRNAEKTRAAILDAARLLFAEQELSEVSIRDIADAAGVSHGLVQQYFGTREQMIAAIIAHEIERFSDEMLPTPTGTTVEDFQVLHERLKAGERSFRQYALLILRAELAGIEPEKMLDPAARTPALQLADAIADIQSRTATGRPPMDPKLVSAYINASIFAFGAMSPWLMTAVGLVPEDYEARLDEIVDISVRLIALACGIPLDS